MFRSAAISPTPKGTTTKRRKEPTKTKYGASWKMEPGSFAGNDVLLEDQLHAVGQELEDPVGPDAVRADPGPGCRRPPCAAPSDTHPSNVRANTRMTTATTTISSRVTAHRGRRQKRDGVHEGFRQRFHYRSISGRMMSKLPMTATMSAIISPLVTFSKMFIATKEPVRIFSRRVHRAVADQVRSLSLREGTRSGSTPRRPAA